MVEAFMEAGAKINQQTQDLSKMFGMWLELRELDWVREAIWLRVVIGVCESDCWGLTETDGFGEGLPVSEPDVEDEEVPSAEAVSGLFVPELEEDQVGVEDCREVCEGV